MINAQVVDGLRPLKDSTITYDAMGNPTSYLGWTLTWEGKQLTSVTDGTHSYSYSYNEDGLRLRKVVDGTDTEYYYNGSVLMYMITGSGSTAVQQRFSYDAAGNLVAVVYKVGSGTSYIYYYLRNAQGDIVKLIDSSGNTVVEYLYDSWGKLIATTGSLANTVGANQPFCYRGYVYDEETGFYYLQSRYHDPETCRFISADVLLSTSQGVLGYNSFEYCGNNPIVRLDTKGRFWDTVFDVVSLAFSIVEVATNPTDPWAWAGLAGDVIDLIPFVTGAGETVKAIKTTVAIVDKADDVVDTAKTIYKIADASSDIKKATGTYEILYKSGKNYVGKGGFRRAIHSAVSKAAKYSDEVVSITWKSAPNKALAFVEEYALQLKRGVLSSNSAAKTYNKIWSPGKRILERMFK